MLKKILSLLLLIAANSSFAERFQDSIHSYSLGHDGEEHLLMLGSGRVAFIDPLDDFHLDEFTPGKMVELDLDKRHTVRSITSLPEDIEELHESEYETMERYSQAPTILSSEDNVARVFRSLNRSWYQETECSDRAHIWAYEEWVKRRLVSRKAFLFFTNTYIRTYRWNWWFHVAPYTLVNTENGVEERVLDPRYLSTQVSMRNWTDFFVSSERPCPEATYRYYQNNRNGREHCILVKADMYYRLPLHVRGLEDEGRVKTRFSIDEVNFSYRAFSRRGVSRSR
jgi:hypothetical protein